MKNGKVDIWPKCPHMRTQAHKGYTFIYICIYASLSPQPSNPHHLTLNAHHSTINTHPSTLQDTRERLWESEKGSGLDTFIIKLIRGPGIDAFLNTFLIDFLIDCPPWQDARERGEYGVDVIDEPDTPFEVFISSANIHNL